MNKVDPLASYKWIRRLDPPNFKQIQIVCTVRISLLSCPLKLSKLQKLLSLPLLYLKQITGLDYFQLGESLDQIKMDPTLS